MAPTILYGCEVRTLTFVFTELVLHGTIV